jgi:ribonuclease E
VAAPAELLEGAEGEPVQDVQADAEPDAPTLEPIEQVTETAQAATTDREQAIAPLPIPGSVATQVEAVETAPATEEVLAPVRVAEAQVTEPQRVAVAEPQQSVPAVQPAPVETAAALVESGLVMVETSPDRVQNWRQPEQAVEVPLPRRRGPAPAPEQPAENLVQIETRK